MAFTTGQEIIRANRRALQRIMGGSARTGASSHLARQDNFGFINAQVRLHNAAMLQNPRVGPYVFQGGNIRPLGGFRPGWDR